MANLSNINNKFIVEDSGDVGIGVTTATTKLHIGGTAPGDSIIRQDSTVSGTNWEIGERAAGKWQIFEDDGDSIVATFMSSGNVGIGTPSPVVKLAVKSSQEQLTLSEGDLRGATFDYRSSTGNLNIATNGINARTNPHLTLNLIGNLGIGVTPSVWNDYGGSKALQFYGSYVYNYRDTNLIIGNNAYYDGAWKYYKASIGATKFNSGNGAFDFAVSSGGIVDAAITWIDALKIDTSGNVGIGTSSTEGKLTISYTAAELPTSGTTSNSAIQVISSLNNQLNLGLNTVSGDYGAYIQASDNNLAVPYPLNLQPNGGNVGIGTDSPVTKLHVQNPNKIDDVYGLLLVENTSTGTGGVNSAVNIKSYYGTSQFMQWEGNGLRVGSRILTNSGAGDVYFTAGADSVKMVIQAGGNVGIGTTAPSYGKLQIDQTSGNNLTLRKGTGQPAIAFGGVTNNEAVCLVEGNGVSGGLKFYNGTGTLASPTWSAGMEFFDSGRLYPYGGVYLGAASSSNLLDDYEEGTFTALLANDGVGNTELSRYTKVGRLVFYQIFMSSKNITNAGNCRVSGLPFASENTQGYGIASYWHGTAITANLPATGYTTGTSIDIIRAGSTAYAQWATGTNKAIMLAGFYTTA